MTTNLLPPVPTIPYDKTYIFERYEKLRDHLRDNVKDEQFNMAYYKQDYVRDVNGYTSLREVPIEAKTFCFACAIGHGYELMPEDYEIVELDYYHDKSWDYYGFHESSNLFQFIAAQKWVDWDNTREGAIRRIEYLLKYHGIPIEVQDQIEVSLGSIS